MAEGVFAGRTALVTGGGRGIGRALCRMLAENGAKVAINYHGNAEAARETLAAIEVAGGEAMLARADVASEQEVGRMVGDIRDRFGPVGLLVNNAGIATSDEHDEFGFE